MEQGHEEGPRRPGQAFLPEAHTAVHSLHQERGPGNSGQESHRAREKGAGRQSHQGQAAGKGV